MGINVYYLAEKLVNSLHHSHLKLVGTVFCGILGFSGMLVYLASIAYLVIRETREGPHLIALTASGSTGRANMPREDVADMQLPQRRAT